MIADWRSASTQQAGHDREFGEGLRKMLENEPKIRQRLGLDDAMWAYMQEAFRD